MPAPLWPQNPCPPDSPIQTVQDQLNLIVFLAGQGAAPNLDMITALAMICAQWNPPRAQYNALCMSLMRAREFAEQGQWFLCASELDHGG